MLLFTVRNFIFKMCKYIFEIALMLPQKPKRDAGELERKKVHILIDIFFALFILNMAHSVLKRMFRKRRIIETENFYSYPK